MNEYKITYEPYIGTDTVTYINAISENEAIFFFKSIRPLSKIISVEWMVE